MALHAAQKKWLAELAVLVGSAPAAQSAPPGEDEEEVEAEADATEADAVEAGDAEAGAASAKAPPPPIEVLQDRRREFKRARAQWVSVKKRAEADLELVKAGAHKVYRADAAQFPKVVAGCKAIDAILDNLDDELRDTLDRYASTPLRAQGKLADLASSATEVLDRYQRYVDADPVMRAIDQKEFADVVVHAPVTKALRDLRKALS